MNSRRNASSLAIRPSPPAILHFHDGGSLRQSCHTALEQSGFKVESITDGAEVWDAIRSKHFNLILTENETPELGGIALARRLRLEGVTLPIIMATCCATSLLDQDLTSIGFAAVLVKPFRISELLGAVNRALRGSGKRVMPV